MLVNEYSVHLVTNDGWILEFDLLVHPGHAECAYFYAREWLAARGVAATNIRRSNHQIRTAWLMKPAIVEQVVKKGYYVSPARGFPEVA